MQDAWVQWERHLEGQRGSSSPKEALYAISYGMMSSIINETDTGCVRNLLQYAIKRTADERWMTISINGWLSSLTPDSGDIAKSTILDHFNKFGSIIADDTTGWSFERPS
jgi:hypothetical protein